MQNNYIHLSSPKIPLNFPQHNLLLITYYLLLYSANVMTITFAEYAHPSAETGMRSPAEAVG